MFWECSRMQTNGNVVYFWERLKQVRGALVKLSPPKMAAWVERKGAAGKPVPLWQRSLLSHVQNCSAQLGKPCSDLEKGLKNLGRRNEEEMWNQVKSQDIHGSKANHCLLGREMCRVNVCIHDILEKWGHAMYKYNVVQHHIYAEEERFSCLFHEIVSLPEGLLAASSRWTLQ